MDKKEKTWREKRNESMSSVLIMVLYGIVIGAVIVVAGLSMNGMYQTLKDDKYLTDDGLPYRDMVNATYTYPAKEIDRLSDGGLWLIAGGIALMGGGAAVAFAVMIVHPDTKDLHRSLCKAYPGIEKTDPKIKYCPECGLKLSKLKKKD